MNFFKNFFCGNKLGNPKTPDIEEAERNATQAASATNKLRNQADRDLASANRLANALQQIREQNHFGESFAKIFKEAQ